MELLATFSISEPAAYVLLLLLLAAPLIGIVVIALTRADRRQSHRDAALGASLGTLLLAVATLALHLSDAGTLARPEPPRPINPFFTIASSFALGADGISVWLVLLTVVLTPLAILASSRSIRRQTRAFYGLILLLESATLGVFLVRDLLWLYIFFELTLIPLYFIIGVWGGPGRWAAANKFFIFTLAGSLVMLGGVLYLGLEGGFGFDGAAGFARSLSQRAQVLVFLLLFAGFAVKVPLVPLHTWLPAAHTEAPTAGSVLLAGVLLKLGAYAFLRIGIGFLPRAAVALAPWMATLAVIGILYGALAAWVQSDIKRLVAYSSVSHLGFCILGMFALRPEGLTGSVLAMVNHGLSTGALFLVVGMIYERYHTRRMSELGGLSRRMPVISFFLVLFALSSMGLPGLNGFVHEVLVLLGTLASSRASGALPPTLGLGFVAVAALGVVLSAVYLLHMLRRVAFGPLKEPEVNDEPTAGKLPADATAREWAILLPLGLLVVLLGLWPQPLTRSMARPVERILAQVAEAAVEQPAPPPPATQPQSSRTGRPEATGAALGPGPAGPPTQPDGPARSPGPAGRTTNTRGDP